MVIGEALTPSSSPWCLLALRTKPLSSSSPIILPDFPPAASPVETRQRDGLGRKKKTCQRWRECIGDLVVPSRCDAVPSEKPPACSLCLIWRSPVGFALRDGVAFFAPCCWFLINMENGQQCSANWSVSRHSVEISGYSKKNCQNDWPAKWFFLGSAKVQMKVILKERVPLETQNWNVGGFIFILKAKSDWNRNFSLASALGWLLYRLGPLDGASASQFESALVCSLQIYQWQTGTRGFWNIWWQSKSDLSSV